MNAKINPAVSQMTSFIVMDVLEKAVEMQKQGIDIIHMEVGEPDFEPSECVLDTARQSYLDKKTHYTHSLGDLTLRNEISKFYKREYGVTISPDQVVVTSGSSPAILMALMTLCEAGSEVILSNPGYPCYRNFVLACNAVPVSVDISAEDGFQYPIEAVKAAITPKTRAIFVNSPMNPTGTLVSDEVYKELAKLNIPIISDEIYHGLVYNGRARSVLEFTNNAFVLNGFSKRYAMTGLRLGFLVAPEEYMRSLQILQQNLFVCAPSNSQEAGISALRDSEKDVDKRREIYNERRIYLIKRLRDMGFIIEKEPQGAFYIFANAKKFTSDSYKFAFDVLENAHVGITPGIDFGSNGEGYVRLSYANSIENLKIGMDRLEAYLKTRK
ncbi:MAG TPA: pyridoxal phosphate-dependent aminotransferase [Paludibacteraceae bacterium]|nr:pyridoxal phosphate-dependent aminotransferase [Paludibacteraceae bacterium]HPH62173.1 pyridoxal phosphate-dependent aminotransferase [Paludibacteraceae bacterium]